MSKHIQTTCVCRREPHVHTSMDLAHTALACIAGFSIATGAFLTGESWIMALAAWVLTLFAARSLLAVIEILQRTQALVNRRNGCPPNSYAQQHGSMEHV